MKGTKPIFCQHKNPRMGCPICIRDEEIKALKAEIFKQSELYRGYRDGAKEKYKALLAENCALVTQQAQSCTELYMKAAEWMDRAKKAETELSFMKTGVNGIVKHQYSLSWHDARKQMIEDLLALIGEKP